jgi:hypothetical protein
VKIRHGPATVSGEDRSKQATGAQALGRQLRSDEPQARRPTEFTPIRIELEGSVGDESCKLARPRYQNKAEECSGSAVKIRHCPATVSDAFFHLQNVTAHQGGKAQMEVASQETGSFSE